MSRVRRIRVLLSAAALLASALRPAPASIAGSQASSAIAGAGTPVDGGAVVWGDVSEPAELNCIRANDGPTLRLCGLFADALIDYGRTGDLVPRLASLPEVSGDGRTFTFRLRKDVRWHDGRPFTSRDVLHSLDQLRHPEGGVAGSKRMLFEPLESREAPDDHTVVLKFRQPYALAYHAWTRLFILPVHLGSEPGRTTVHDRAPVGTGPYRVAGWDPQKQIVLEANPDYFGGRPHIDRIVYRIVPNVAALARALRAGELDVAGLPPSEAPPEGEESPFRIVRAPGNYLDAVIWNLREPRGLFRDVRVRRALTLAFDRKAYIEKIKMGADLPAVSIFHPLGWAHDPNLLPLPHDPKAAAALLAEAGWRDGDGDGILDTPSGPASFTLCFRSGVPDLEKSATLFQAAVKPVGVEVRLQALEGKVWMERTRTGNYEAVVYRWLLSTDPDPYDYFHSSQHPEGQNYGGYANPEFDRLAEEGRRATDRLERAALYHRIERILREDQPYTFISHPGIVLGVSKRLRGVEVSPIQGLFGWSPSVRAWWIPASEQKRRP
jgi:peptide/nickel transport system substrate-binding protein